MKDPARWALFWSTFLAAALFYQPREYDNTKSRYMLLAAAVDQGRLSIDSWQQDTVDKALAGRHYYSNKAFGLPLVAAPVYWALRRARLVGPLFDDAAAGYFVRVAAVSLPFALLVILLYDVGERLGARRSERARACLAYAFGTIALNHATIFSGHETSAFFLFASFALLLRQEEGAGRAFLAGLCAGLGVLCDYIGVFAALVLAWYALTSRRTAFEKSLFAAGAGLCAALLAAYDRACFGAASSLSYAHNEFLSFNRGAAQGLWGISWPKPGAAAALLASPARGLFFISPVLLLSLAGLGRIWRRPALRREAIVLALCPASTFLAGAGFYAWDGGWTYGPRYLVPALPFLAAPLALAAGACAFWPLLGLSIFQAGCAQVGWPHTTPRSWNPIAELILPLLNEEGTSLSLLGLGRAAAWAGALQLAALFGLAAWAVRGPIRRVRLPAAWRQALFVWVFYVAAVLLLARTPSPADIHYNRGLLLNDAYWELGWPGLAEAASKEFALGPVKPR